MSPKLTDEKKKQNKIMIAEKSLETFKEHGFHETSMSIIAKATGMSKGGIYAYFDDKEDLFLFILDYLLNDKPTILETVNQNDSAYAQLVNQWERVIFSWSDLDFNSTKLIFEFWMEAGKNPSYREKLIMNYSITEKYFVDIIQKGKDDGEFKKEVEPELITQMFWSYIDGQVQFWIARNHKPNYEELKKVFNQLLILLEGVRKDD